MSDLSDTPIAQNTIADSHSSLRMEIGRLRLRLTQSLAQMTSNAEEIASLRADLATALKAGKQLREAFDTLRRQSEDQAREIARLKESLIAEHALREQMWTALTELDAAWDDCETCAGAYESMIQSGERNQKTRDYYRAARLRLANARNTAAAMKALTPGTAEEYWQASKTKAEPGKESSSI